MKFVLFQIIYKSQISKIIFKDMEQDELAKEQNVKFMLKMLLNAPLSWMVDSAS